MKDSINRDVGKDIGDTLVEREIVALKEDSRISSQTVITPAPTPVPQVAESVPSPDMVTTTSTNFASGSTGIAVIVTCAVVALLIGGFVFYKGMQRSKIDDEAQYWDTDDFSSDRDSAAKAKVAALYAQDGYEVSDQDTDDAMAQDLPSSDGDSPDEMPAHYSGAETNIFGVAVGSSRHLVNAQDMPVAEDDRDRWLDEKIQNHDDITRLDSFESRVRRKGNEMGNSRSSAMRSESQRRLDAFDSRVANKLNHSKSTPSMQRQTSNSRIEDFDSRLQSKLESRERGRSPASSDRATSTWDEKLQRKLSRSGRDTERRPSDGSQSSFEDR